MQRARTFILKYMIYNKYHILIITNMLFSIMKVQEKITNAFNKNSPLDKKDSFQVIKAADK